MMVRAGPKARPLLQDTVRTSPVLLKLCTACARTYARYIFQRLAGANNDKPHSLS